MSQLDGAVTRLTYQLWKQKIAEAWIGLWSSAVQASYPIKKTPNPPTPPPVPPPTPGPPAPPSPEPEVCDTATSCPPGSTCCCMREFFGYCFTWACCPLKEATCCDDHEHCCPSNLPVCDTVAGRCLSGNADDWANSVPWVSKVIFHLLSGLRHMHALQCGCFLVPTTKSTIFTCARG